MPSTALTRISRTSISSGLGNVTFDIHRFPLMPGSFKLNLCCFEIGVGVGESRRARMRRMVSSVLRSHLVDVGERRRECHSAVLSRKGTWGTTIRIRAVGVVSIASGYEMGRRQEEIEAERHARDVQQKEVNT